jgi:hypothetical protein
MSGREFMSRWLPVVGCMIYAVQSCTPRHAVGVAENPVANSLTAPASPRARNIMICHPCPVWGQQTICTRLHVRHGKIMQLILTAKYPCFSRCDSATLISLIYGTLSWAAAEGRPAIPGIICYQE